MFVVFNSRSVIYNETTAEEDDVEATYCSKWQGAELTSDIIKVQFWNAATTILNVTNEA